MDSNSKVNINLGYKLVDINVITELLRRCDPTSKMTFYADCTQFLETLQFFILELGSQCTQTDLGMLSDTNVVMSTT